MSKLVHNERMKLIASFFNNCGVAAFATGMVVPVVSISYLRQPWPFNQWINLYVAGVSASLLIGGWLCLIALWVIGKLKE